MRRKPRTLSRKQQSLLTFLKANKGRKVTLADVAVATRYEPASISAYLSKFDLGRYLRRQVGGGFIVADDADFSAEALLVALTQSNVIRQIGSKCAHPLAKALVRKARDNMILALELYNRPSLENRLDAFSMLFCTAWEQVLKAEIIEAEGQSAIFRPLKPGRRRESISLEEACEERLLPGDPVRDNVARIAELRHGATHLLMPEVQGVLSRLFQAGILNFSRRFATVAGSSLLPPGASGLLSVVGDWAVPDAFAVRQTYGEQTGADIEGLIKELSDSIERSNDERFAVSVHYSLVLSKSPGGADIKLTTSSSGIQTTLVVEKAVSADRSHPHRMSKVVDLIRQKCGATINVFDVQAALAKEKWKNGDNEFHHHQVVLNTHWYSDKCVDELIKRIQAEPTYLANARQSHSRARKARSAARTGGG